MNMKYLGLSFNLTSEDQIMLSGFLTDKGADIEAVKKGILKDVRSNFLDGVYIQVLFNVDTSILSIRPLKFTTNGRNDLVITYLDVIDFKITETVTFTDNFTNEQFVPIETFVSAYPDVLHLYEKMPLQLLRLSGKLKVDMIAKEFENGFEVINQSIADYLKTKK